MSSLSFILQHKVVAILRGISHKEIVNIVNALYDGGIRLVEITLNSDDAIKTIEEISKYGEHRMLVGAGTVLSPADAENAIHAGAQFIISPSFDPEVIAETKKAGKISIPGAFTPTEIVSAKKYGADIVKVFPSPGPAYIKDLLAPLNNVRLMPTGGVGVENIKAYQQAGAVAFGIGSSLVSSNKKVDDVYLNHIRETARSLVQAVTTEDHKG